jgi:hypothetical protein
MYALILVMGSLPWCLTDGDSYDCYYYRPVECQRAEQQYNGWRWCERNPQVYNLDGRRWELDNDFDWSRSDPRDW